MTVNTFHFNDFTYTHEKDGVFDRYYKELNEKVEITSNEYHTALNRSKQLV